MFKKILALVLATMMVLGGMVTVSAAEEADAPAVEEVTYDYTAAAEDLAALGIFKGKVIDGNTIDFALEDGVTRLQFALFVARIMTGETNDEYWSKVNDNTTPYDDVVNYFGAVSFADENGIIKGKGWIPGIGDNCFDPNGAITFQDAITMAVRALGYKQLQYPNGFLTVGEELGLTADLEPLDKEAELTRGQMIQILKNMLYIKVDGAASFAQQNFGLEEKTYVIVATEYQYLAGTDRVYRVDYAGAKANEQVKYVALAPLNSDGTYDFDAIVHFTEEELGLAQGESEMKLGYSYTASSFDKFATAEFDANETVKYTNYGTDKDITSGSKYTNITDNIVNIAGTTYKLVKEFTNLDNKATYANKQPELIIHSMFVGATDMENVRYAYDYMGNILDPYHPNADGSLPIAIMYNGWSQTYYCQDATTGAYYIATDADFAAVAISDKKSTEQFGVTTSATEMVNVAFSELTLIDDNNDGVWDRGIYIPYSVGKYHTTADQTTLVVADSAYSSSANKTAARINDAYLDAYYTDKATGDFTYYNKIQASDVIWAGEGRPTANQYILYYYNPYAHLCYVAENLGTPVTGTVNSMTQGTYTYDATANYNTYYYKNGTVTIDGKTYGLGWRVYETASQYTTAAYDLVGGQFTAELAYYGYSSEIYDALVGQAYRKLSYLVLADRIIYANDSSTTVGVIAFDYGEDKSTTTPITTYDYEGDIMGVDADGNILVKGYAGTNEEQILKIGSINGYSYGLLVEDYAALQYNFSGISILNNASYNTMIKLVIMNFFETLDKDLEAIYNDPDMRQYVYIVTGFDEATGVYDIYTDLNLYWNRNNNLVTSWRQPDVIEQANDSSDTLGSHNPARVTFYDGISHSAYIEYAPNSGSHKAIVLNQNSVILVAANDGLFVHTGIPVDGATLKLSANKTDDVDVYAMSNDFIFVASATLAADQIWDGGFDSYDPSNDYTYYLVLGRANTSNTYDDTDTYATAQWDATTGKVVYNYYKLYNINTGEYANITLYDEPLPAYGTATGLATSYMPKPIGAIYAEKNGDFFLLNDPDKLVNINVSGGVMIPTSYSYASAADSMDVLTKVLYSGIPVGTTYYAPVFDNAKVLGARSANAGMINFADGTYIADQKVAMTYDELIYTVGTNADDEKTYTRIELKNNRGVANDDRNNAVYFNYKSGSSFQAVSIDGTEIISNTDIKDVVTTQISTGATGNLATAINKAIAALEAITDVNKYAASELATAKSMISNAANLAEVEGFASYYTTVINTAIANGKKAESDAEAEKQSWTEYKTAFTALQSNKYYNDATVKVGGATLKAHVDAWVTAATNNGVYGSSTLTLDDAKKALDDANKAIQDKDDAIAAAQFDATIANTETATVITLKNVPTTAKTLQIWADEDGDSLYKDKKVGVDLPTTGSSDIKINWTRNGDDVTVTLYKTDGYNNIPALATGSYRVVIGHGAAADSQVKVVTIG